MKDNAISDFLDGLEIDQQNSVIDLLESLNEGILIVDKDYKIIYYNKTLETIENLEAQDVIGRNFFEVFPDKSIANSTIYQCMKDGTKIVDQLEKYYTYRGNSVSVLNTTIPLYKDGEIIAVLDLSKDLNHLNQLIKTNDNAYSNKNNHKKKNYLKTKGYSFEDIMTKSDQMKHTIHLAKRAAQQDSNVLIVGETGTGKELFAQSIHHNSKRGDKAFIAINCAAIPTNLMESILFGTVKGSYTGALDKAGLFEQASGGTLLLDEINSLELQLQAKLLRVLQEGTFRRIGGDKEIQTDVRIIATTNDQLMDLINDKTFRLDLYYRLSVITIDIPPLRHRVGDIPYLANFFLKLLSDKMQINVPDFSEKVLNAFEHYEWIGNVRELRNVVESAICLYDHGDEITIDQLPKQIAKTITPIPTANSVIQSKPLTLKESLEQHEKQVILETLENCHNNITSAAKILGLSRQSLQYRMKKLSIDRSEAQIIYNKKS